MAQIEMTTDQLIEVAHACDYSFIKEDPKGRLLFWDVDQEQEVQFWIPEKYALNALLTLFIKRAYASGVSRGIAKTQMEIKIHRCRAVVITCSHVLKMCLFKTVQRILHLVKTTRVIISVVVVNMLNNIHHLTNLVLPNIQR